MSVKWLSTSEVARLINLSDDAVLRRIHDGRIPAVRCGRLYRIRMDQIGGASCPS